MKPTTTISLRVLHLEDDSNDALLIRDTLQNADLNCEIVRVHSESEFTNALDCHHFDLILSDGSIPGLDCQYALALVREKNPGTPFIFVSGYFSGEKEVAILKAAGATDCVLKSDLQSLPMAVEHALESKSSFRKKIEEDRFLIGMERLITVVQELSLSRDLTSVMIIVRKAARELTGADGATFILKENDKCFYADEDAIAPLWKGKRFPMTACISGWAMLNKTQAVIEDIYVDDRIPIDAYRPTFVKSLVMVPIRTLDPIGAIGNYWAVKRKPSSIEVRLLQALADTVAVALENVQVYADLEQRVKDRTAQLETANNELEAFSFAVSHDLKAPLRHIQGFTVTLSKNYDNVLDEQGKGYLHRIIESTQRMGQITNDLLNLARMTQLPINRTEVNLIKIAEEIISNLKSTSPNRNVEFISPSYLLVSCDEKLIRIALENLLSNAWKFTGKKKNAVIELGLTALPEGKIAYFIRDNGAGFDIAQAKRLFGVFQRMHTQNEFSGTGVGLANVQRIIQKHHGEIWADAEIGKGATFYFTLK